MPLVLPASLRLPYRHTTAVTYHASMATDAVLADGTPRRNLELKARLTQPTAAHAVARQLAATPGGVLQQRDTYFHVPVGRLKLRAATGHGAELIFYKRDEAGPDRWSDYRVTPLADPTGLALVLAAALGRRGVVAKQRTLYGWRDCRIHIDRVEQLGDFLEFEVRSIGDEHDDRARLAILTTAFGLQSADFVADSYADLLRL